MTSLGKSELLCATVIFVLCNKSRIIMTGQSEINFNLFLFILRMDHFTVVFSVAWLLYDREAGGDLTLIQTSPLLLGKLSPVPVLHLKKKSKEVCMKARSPPASLAFVCQVTWHTTLCKMVHSPQLLQGEKRFLANKIKCFIYDQPVECYMSIILTMSIKGWLLLISTCLLAFSGRADLILYITVSTPDPS